MTTKAVRWAAKLLSQEDAEDPPPPSPQARTEAIAALERALREKARRRRVRRIALGGVALAAVAACAVLWIGIGPGGHPASHAHAGGPARTEQRTQAPDVIARAAEGGARIVGGRPVGDNGQALAPGARVLALPHGHALLAFATGTRVTVEEGGDVTMVRDDAAQVLALEGGALRADVAKLAPGHRFIVRTLDAEIEVHGTSFRVATVPADPTCGEGTRTRVEVFEGVVTVRRGGVEARVPSGERWPAGCEAQALARARDSGDIGAPVHSAVYEAPAIRAAPQPELDSDRAAAAAPVSSRLVEQNDAFAAAVAARHAGDAARALRAFDALLSRYPDGPLAESASAQRMKLLRELGSARATLAARAYLAQYPNGFARADAEAILADMQ